MTTEIYICPKDKNKTTGIVMYLVKPKNELKNYLNSYLNHRISNAFPFDAGSYSENIKTAICVDSDEFDQQTGIDIVEYKSSLKYHKQLLKYYKHLIIDLKKVITAAEILSVKHENKINNINESLKKYM